MKLAFSSTGTSIDDQIDPRFGRCRYFVIVDSETMDFESFENMAAGASGGAGISAAQAVIDRGAQVVLTGSVGPNADQALSAANVEYITGVSGTIRDAVNAYKSGNLQSSGSGQFPVGSGSGMGVGMGRGMGMGRGGGRGRGQGGGRGMGFKRWASPQSSPSKQPIDLSTQEVGPLQQQLAMIMDKLEQIEKRLKKLEG
jgi:predicted Fe-Mo cluster-binding NifX family protein